MKISVCLAAYNGSKYIGKQISSILCQLRETDELVIVDDNSTDETVKIVEDFKDPRIKLIKNMFNIGIVKNFEKAISQAFGDIIFLSDQDDIWDENKVTIIRTIFEQQDIDILVHDAIVVDGNYTTIHQSLFKYRNSSPGLLKNIFSNTYIGCCMAFRKDILSLILPIPDKKGIHHDFWIGIIAEAFGLKTKFLDSKLISFVRHGNNNSTLNKRKASVILYERLLLISLLLKRVLEYRYFKIKVTKK
jgi:glycosyltransferase involved in cell wall biosynthesis